MIEYNLISLDGYVSLGSFPELADSSEVKRILRSILNVNKLIDSSGLDKVVLVSPVRDLSDGEVEEYRKFFCKKAKLDKCNYVYFTRRFVLKSGNILF